MAQNTKTVKTGGGVESGSGGNGMGGGGGGAKKASPSATSRSIEVFSRFSTEEAARIKAVFNENATRMVMDSNGRKARVLKRETFNRLMHSMFGLTHETILEGLFRAFNVKSPFFVERSEWLLGLSAMTRGSFKERIEFAWHVYDIQVDDVLSREEMFLFLRDTIIGPKDTEELNEAVNDLIETLFRQLDVTSDGRVDKSDFVAAVHRQPALLECLGQVFPSGERLKVFETAIGDKCDTLLDNH